MVRTNQGGSVLSFLVIGVILVGLLVGGVYYISQRSAQTEETLPQPSPSTPEKTSPSGDPVAPPSADKDNQPANTPAAPQPAASSPAHELPQTGTKEVAGTLFVIAIFSATLVSYVRSRRPVLSL